ncbi:MAG: CRISPR-associated endoribonuclease Cas6 [Caldimicrobium sp.]
MPLKIRFSNPGKSWINLPTSYNEILQGFIYNHLDKSLAKALHNEGFEDSRTKRKLKFFTFSRLISQKVQLTNGILRLYGELLLVICSPYQDFLHSLATNLLKAEKIRLGEEELFLSSIEVFPSPKYKERILVKTLSPITVYSTLKTPSGKKKTYYYSPFEREFEELLLKNLHRKVRVWFGKEVEISGSIKPYKVSSKNQRIVIYKRYSYKRVGWNF